MNLQAKTSESWADESSIASCPVEWWFVQGRFEGEGVAPREFMVSFFRHGLEWACFSLGNSYVLMISVLDPVTGRSRILSQVDETTFSFLPVAEKVMPMEGLDKTATRAVIDEIKQYGPPSGITVGQGKPKLKSKPFCASWGDFELRQELEHFVLKFKEPETGRLCVFRLAPIHPRIHLKNMEAPGGGHMDYASYSRQSLEGEVDGHPVGGTAWFDHQWGARGWLLGDKKQETVYGWDWLGVQLDDCSEWLFFVHRDMCINKTVGQFAVEVGVDGKACVHHDFNLGPLSWWTSPNTETRYPIGCSIRLPAVGLDLQFEPFTEDQEIPALPPIRAVWEGAGRVMGIVRGQRVAGTGRLELHGYAFLTNIREFMERMAQRIHESFATFIPRSLNTPHLERWAGTVRGQYDVHAQSAMIATPLWDIIDRGGKHWRPIFGILLLRALGVNPRPYETLISITTEIPHAGAMIIDDIQDKARNRRGEECVHLRYGLDVAINAGNTAYFIPMILVGEYPGLSELQRLELYRVLGRLLIGAHLGQGQDIFWSKNLSTQRLQEWMADGMDLKIIQLYTQKTASVVEAAAECASIVAGVNGERRAACVSFGQTLGIAFQIVNDIADFSAERVNAGDGGADLREGKISYVVLRALQRLRSRQRQRLETLLCDPILRHDEEALAEGIKLVRDSGVLELCQKEACDMVEKEWDRLSKHLPASESKQMLRVLWTVLLKRSVS